MTRDESDKPPPGYGWIKIAEKIDFTLAWAEIRNFGGELYGQPRTGNEACFFIHHVSPRNPRA